MSTRLAAKKSAEGSDTEEESELAAAILNQEARLEGLRIAGEELEERLKRDLLEAVDLALDLLGVIDSHSEPLIAFAFALAMDSPVVYRTYHSRVFSEYVNGIRSTFLP